jgi:hypothetical protein
MRTLPLIAISSMLSCWSSLAAPAQPEREIPPLPADCLYEGGGMLGGKFAYKIVSCDGEQAMLLERFIERRGEEAVFQTLDRLALPKLQKGQSILDTVLCESLVDETDSVFGIGSWKNEQDGSIVAEQISHAWRFDLQQGKIEVIAAHEIKCVGESAD